MEDRAPELPADSDSVAWRGQRAGKEKEGPFEFNRTPTVWCLSRVLAFYLLSVLLPLRHLLPSLSSVCLLADQFVSLSGFSQTLRHLLPTETHRLRDNITAAETGGRRRGGEAASKERQMYRQSTGGGGMGISHTSIIGYVPRSQAAVVVDSSILEPTMPSQMKAWTCMGKQLNCTHIPIS